MGQSSRLDFTRELSRMVSFFVEGIESDTFVILKSLRCHLDSVNYVCKAKKGEACYGNIKG